jgi:hypothetical protein
MEILTVPRNSTQSDDKCDQKPPIANNASKTGVRRVLPLHLNRATSQTIPERIEISNLAHKGAR